MKSSKGSGKSFCEENWNKSGENTRELLELHVLCSSIEMKALFKNMIFVVEICLDFATNWIYRQGGVGGV